MRILLVAHYFPPDGGAGSQRPASFVRHAAAAGARVTVVTRAVDGSRRGRYEPADPGLLEWCGDADIRRTVRAPGEDWTAALTRAATSAARDTTPDVVLVTLSPFEHAAVGPAVRSASGVPFVLDLRDPWALDGWHTYAHAFAWRRARERMRRAIEEADGVVLNVPGAVAPVEALAPRIGRTPCTVVTNGWEPADFPEVRPVERQDRLRIRFAGTFVCRFMRHRSPLGRIRSAFLGRGERIDERGRSPLFLLRAIDRLHREGFDGAGDFLLEIAGATEPEVERIVAESHRASQVRSVGYLRHDDSVRFIAGADALLLPMHGLPPGSRARMVPGKLYEYLATGRPILGLCPEGDARDWIPIARGSRLADPVDEIDVARALRELHGDWSAGRLVESRRDPQVERWSRESQTLRLVEYLSKVLADHRGGSPAARATPMG